MNLFTPKIFSEKRPIHISFQTTKAKQFNEGIKARIHNFNKAIPIRGMNNKYNSRHTPNSIGVQSNATEAEKLLSKNKTVSDNRYPLAGDYTFRFPAITDPMKYKNQSVSLKDIQRPQAKLLKGQNQLIFEKLRGKREAENKEKGKHQRKIRTDIHFFQKAPSSKSLSRDHCILPFTKTHAPTIEQRRSNAKNSKSSNKTTINFFKQSYSSFSLKPKEREVTTLDNEKHKGELSKPSGNDKQSKSDYEQTKEREKSFLYNKNTSLDFRRNDHENENGTIERKTFHHSYSQLSKKETIIRTTKRNWNNNLNTSDCVNDNPIESNNISKRIAMKGNEGSNSSVEVGNDYKLQPIDIEKSVINSSKSVQYPEMISANESMPSKLDQGKKVDNDKEREQEQEQEQEAESNFKKKRSASSFSLKDINVSNIISKVIENNKRAAEASSKLLFSEIGKDYRNTHSMYKSNINFFYSNNSAKNSASSVEIQDKPFTLNSINIQLMTPIEWKKHEESWSSLNLECLLTTLQEASLIPPNENDALVSSYFKLFPSMISHSEYSKAESLSQKKDYCLSLVINDKLQNPKVEMRKWKDAYKRVVHRWHPDKLFGMLANINLKSKEATTMILRRKSPVIINNANAYYKKIMETLTKIYQAKCKTSK